MDLLFSRYASPMEFMKLYIDNGRFGEFVEEVLALDRKRKDEEEEKEKDNKLWTAYLLSGAKNKTFAEWKSGLTQKQEHEPVSYSMTTEQIEAQKQHSRGILKKISPV
jgi:hypothetical protein